MQKVVEVLKLEFALIMRADSAVSKSDKDSGDMPMMPAAVKSPKSSCLVASKQRSRQD